MPGKICDGNDASLNEIRNSKAYCEGMAYRAGGTAAGRPLTGNPYDGDGSEAETAWDAGWAVADGAAGGTLTKTQMGCCSVQPAVSA